MLKPRYLRQRQLAGLSLSLLLHGTAAIGISLAPTRLLRDSEDLTEAVYIDEAGTAPIPGAQASSAPLASGTANDAQDAGADVDEAAPVAQPTNRSAIAPTDSTPDVVTPEKIAEAPRELPKKTTMPKKPVPTTTLPAKTKAMIEDAAASDDQGVKTALENARTEDSRNLENAGVDAEADADSDTDDLKERPEEQPETRSAEAWLPEAEPEEPVAQTERETGDASEDVAEPPTVTTQSASRAAVPAPVAAHEGAAHGGPTHGGDVIGGGTSAHGVRDASELRAMSGNRAPVYPERDRLMRNQGTVVFIARVLPDGTVTDIQLEKSAQSKSLDLSALEAMKKWRFQSGQQGMVRKGFTFSLDGTAEELPARLRR